MNYTYDAENFRRVFQRSFTWLAGFRRNVGRSPDKTALIDPLRGETWSYLRLDRETDRLANALRAHGVGAGGVTELIACVKALETGLLPPNLGFTGPDEACSLPLVTEPGRRAKLRAAMSNAFGFGGQNSSLIVGRAE